MSGLKSSYEIAMEKMKTMGIDDTTMGLTEQQKEYIAQIRSEYNAKIAEKKILLKDEAVLPNEIAFLERERDRKVEAVYKDNKKE